MTDYHELKRLAEAATQGHWMYECDDLFFKDAEGFTKHLMETCEGQDIAIGHDSNLKFIAAANPAAVLALIAENERIKARLCVCRDCGGEGEIYYGHSTYQGYNQPPEPDMEVCGTCGGDGVLGPLEDFEALAAERDQLKAEVEALRESNDKLTRRNEMLEQNVKVMTETHVLYTWLRKKVDQPSNDFVAVHMNIGHDWTPVHDLDRDLRGMIEREEP